MSVAATKRKDGAVRGRINVDAWCHTALGRHRFRGLFYRIYAVSGEERGWARNGHGLTTDRRARQRLLFLKAATMHGRAAAVCALHEGLHACFGSKLTEAEVTEAAFDLVGFLQRCRVLPLPKKTKKAKSR